MFKRIILLLLLVGVFTINANKLVIADEYSELPPLKIGVNRFAWYSALQTINFMPLISADPFSGVILTDWYGVNDNERYKIDVYLLEEALTSETVQVRVFKQVKNNGIWVSQPVKESMQTQIENSILDQARKLRIEYNLSNK